MILYVISSSALTGCAMAEHRLVKLVGKILANRKNVEYNDLKRLLEGFGFECRQPRGGSSHYVFRRPNTNPITVPKNRPVNKTYVDQVIDLLNLEEWYEQNS